ncbi:unnamed protein product [Staurois parvus]|uniref:Uncharacterized protein n=1 Tax=Staurois parvus TaxID=386267 RepID=A0ABN9FTI8_9NEOB|nr:unnamed protein product [Staurois parvus]
MLTPTPSRSRGRPSPPWMSAMLSNRNALFMDSEAKSGYQSTLSWSCDSAQT